MKVGITGGIGSGKSTVCRIFETLGIPVYYADLRAKELMHRDPQVVQALKELFGNDVYDRQGALRTSMVAAQVFGDEEKLRRLNAIVHPATIRDADEWAARQQAPYVLKEAALMFESASFHSMDWIIGVSAPEALRIRRTVERDGSSPEEVRKRMRNQLDEGIRLRLCDEIIYNDEQQLLIPQVLRIHESLLAAAKR